MKVALIGASGFVGGYASRHLAAAGHTVVAIGRAEPRSVSPAYEWRSVGAFEDVRDWSAPLHGVDAVVYLAARVHVMHDDNRDPLDAYRAVNTRAAMHAAEGAARAGSRRFVYISSIKVNGESTLIGRAFNEDAIPAPTDPYGVSKFEAETGLAALGATTGLQVVSLRPPMVYGPGARGNVPRLAKLARVAARVPLPIASVKNRRSLLFVEHFADAIVRIVEAPGRLASCYLIADSVPVSTRELIETVGHALGLRPRFIPFPTALMRGAAAVTGLSAVADRLFGSLEVDASALRRDVGWSSPTRFVDAIRRTFAPGAPQS